MNKLKFPIFWLAAGGFLILTFLVVWGLGTISMTTLTGIITGTPSLVFSRDIADVPLVWYAFSSSYPTALTVSIISWTASLVFGLNNKRSSIVPWFVFQAVSGFAIGCLAAIPFLMQGMPQFVGAGLTGIRLLFLYPICFAATGILCCILLCPGWYLLFSFMARKLSGPK
jgi:hypothetical protein